MCIEYHIQVNMYHVSAQGVDERMINVHYYYLGKCTHQCDETQENNSAQALSTKIVFFGCIVFFQCKKINSVSLPAPEEDNVCRKRLCTIVFRRIDQYIFPDLNLCLSSCTGRQFLSKALVALVSTLLPQICSVLSTSSAVVHSFLQKKRWLSIERGHYLQEGAGFLHLCSVLKNLQTFMS